MVTAQPGREPMAPTPDDSADRLNLFLRIAGWSGGVLLLLLPLVAMQFSEAVLWTAGDFLIASAIIGAAGLAAEGLLRASRDWGYRIAAALTVVGGFALVFASGAVGVVGAESHPANLAYPALMLALLCAGVLARGRAGAMSRVAAAGAAGLVLIATVVAATGVAVWGEGLGDALAVTFGFALAFLIAAALFRAAAGRARRAALFPAS